MLSTEDWVERLHLDSYIEWETEDGFFLDAEQDCE